MVESNFLSPTMQGDIRPAENRAVPNPLGPLNAGPGVEELLPAVNPGVASQAPRERGLGGQQEGPRFSDTLAAVGRIVDGVGGLLNVGASFNQSEEDKEAERLRPLVERLNTIKSGIEQGSSQGGIAQANLAVREYIALYPTDINTVKSLYSGVFGVDLGFGGTPDAQAIENEQLAKWMQTPVGQNSIIAANAYKTPEERNAYIYQKFVEDSNLQAELVRVKQVVETTQGTEAIREAADREVGRKILPTQVTLAKDFALGVVSGAQAGDFDLDTINGLQAKRAELALQFQSEYLGAGIPVAQHETYLSQALGPIDNVIAMVEGNAEALNTLVGFEGNKGTMRLQELITSMNDPVLSAIAGSREGMGYFIESLIRTEDANIQIAVANMRAKAAEGLDPSNDSGLLNPTAADLFKKGYLDYFRQNNEAANLAYKTGATVLAGANILEESGMGNSIVALRDMMASSIATDSAISLDSFSRGFVQNIDKINLLLSEPDEISDGLTRQLNAFTQDQLLRHRTVFTDSANALPSGFFLQYDGTSVTLGFDSETFERADNDLTNRVKFLLKQKGLAPTVENIGNVISNARGIIRDTLNTPQGLLSDADPATQGPLQNQRRDAVYGNLKTAWDSMNQSLNTINTITQFALDVPNIAENYSDGLELVLEDQTNAANFVGGLTTQEAEQIQARWAKAKTFNTEEDFFVAAERGDVTKGEPVIINGERYYAEFEE